MDWAAEAKREEKRTEIIPEEPPPPPFNLRNCRVAVVGAGLIGFYLTGCLVDSLKEDPKTPLARVTLVGRPRLKKSLEENDGFSILDMTGKQKKIHLADFHLQTDTCGLDQQDYVLICVKSFDTEATLQDIKQNNKFENGTPLFLSMQNGVRNSEVMRKFFPFTHICSASVGFNVVLLPGLVYKKTTATPLIIHEKATREQPIVRALRFAGLDCYSTPAIRPVLYSKLLINLNNSVNALAGIPVLPMLKQWKYRKILSELMKEGIATITANGISIVRYGKNHPKHIPYLLEVPDWLFYLLSPFFIKIDPKARSSMLEDLDAGKRTEIDLINGEVVHLGKEKNLPTPLNQKVVELIKKYEEEAMKSGGGSPCIPADQLYEIVFEGRQVGLSSPIPFIFFFILFCFCGLIFWLFRRSF